MHQTRSPRLSPVSDDREAEDGTVEEAKCIAAMQWLEDDMLVKVVCALTLSAVPGAGAACFCFWVEAVGVSSES